MFVGHYSAAFALKAKEPKASLGWLFIATQFVDILFFPFTIWGWETITFEPGFTQTNDFIMHFPYTHSLVGTCIWSLVFALGYLWFYGPKKNRAKQVAVVMGLAVLSHWVADLFVHTPDLPLLHGDPKFGFGLWHNKAATFGLEAVLLLLGLGYYLKKTTATAAMGRYAALVLVGLLLVVNYLNYYVLPANHDVVGLAISALVAYIFLAALAFWVGGKRR